MLVEDKIQNVTRFGVGKTREFQIAANAQAFKILSSGLYSNKPRAIIREVCCNAWDAHVAADNTKTPFKIVFPTILEPTLSIRDFGTGIDPDEIEEIYTTYFFSTKRESNDFTGCLGLGTKSILCYTNNFNVINFYNGKKYTHVVYLNEVGTPEISLLATEDTNEHNGIEVSFDVSSIDFYSFTSAINDVLQYFPLKPDIRNGTNVSIPEFKPEWQQIALDDKIYRYNLKHAPAVLMGNVRYPLRPESVPDFGNAKQVLQNLLLAVEIGDVNVVASREDLEYDKKTISFITNIAKKIYKELCRDFENAVAKCDNEYQVKCVCGEYKSKSNIRLVAVWNNKTYSTNDDVVEIPAHFVSDKHWHYNRFNAHKNRYLVVMDTTHNRHAKIRQIDARVPMYDKVFLADEYIEDDTFRYTGRMLAYKMARTIGIPKDKILFLSDEKLPKKPKLDKNKTLAEFECKNTYFNYKNLTDIKEGYYVIAYRGFYYNETKKTSTGHRISQFAMNIARALDFKKPIYIINYSDVKLLKQLPLKSAIEYASNKLDAKLMQDVKQRLNNHSNFTQQSYYGTAVEIINCVKKSSSNKKLVDILSLNKPPKAPTNDEQSKLSVYEKIFGTIELDNTQAKPYNFKDEIIKRYPMLSYLWRSYESGAIFQQRITDYIQLVDQGAKS